MGKASVEHIPRDRLPEHALENHSLRQASLAI